MILPTSLSPSLPPSLHPSCIHVSFLQSKDAVEAQSYMSVMGGKLEELSNRMIGIDDMVSDNQEIADCWSAMNVNWTSSLSSL